MVDFRIENEKKIVRTKIQDLLLDKLPQLSEGLSYSRLVLSLTATYFVSDKFIRDYIRTNFIEPGIITQEGDTLYNWTKSTTAKVEESKNDKEDLYINK